jgi:hypothetical protein
VALHGRRQLCGAATVQQCIQSDRQDPLERERADGRARQAEHGQGHRVRADDPAVLRQCQQTFGDGADAFGPRVQTQSHGGTVLRFEELVLDHAGRRADQAEVWGW